MHYNHQRKIFENAGVKSFVRYEDFVDRNYQPIVDEIRKLCGVYSVK
jgi:hypothetical protein